MPDYQIEIHYGADEPIRIPLRDYEPEDAESERQSIVQQVERAQSLDAPLIITDLEHGGPLDDELAIPVHGVTEVDLVEA
ncbi:MAG: hypothetical protein QOE97_646 [Pseudonocardiales bacterium]|jgi:hypothetical protein|nr:hypothetical protein [Pseudonocardiales bacterium]